jgi:hypothetical protein
MQAADARPSARPGARAARAALALATAAAFLLVIHNFAADILPDRTVRLETARIRPYSEKKTFAYVYPFDGSEPDRWPTLRSRLVFLEDGHPYSLRAFDPAEVALVGASATSRAVSCFRRRTWATRARTAGRMRSGRRSSTRTASGTWP